MQRIGLLLLGVLYVGFFMPHFVLLRELPDGWRWVLFTVYVAMGSRLRAATSPGAPGAGAS